MATRDDIAATEKAGGFDAFFRSAYPKLAQALLLLCANRMEAEDLAQEALARAYEQWDRVQKMESPEGYVFRTAMNLNRKRLRRVAVRTRRWPRLGWFQPDVVAAAEMRRDILAALDSVTRPQRESLILVDWLGVPVNDAAAILHVRPTSLRTRLHRGRAALRQRLGGTYG
jgi:RNA polymerase sigma-70 factor (ECF subfamily)